MQQPFEIAAARQERLARALLVAGLLLVVAGFVKGWRDLASPAGSWGADALVLDAALLLAGLAAAAAGLVLHGRALETGRLTPATFLHADDEARVLDAVRTFEARTSGEIRVHFCGRLTGTILDEARATFERLGMTATRERNGVLFFVSVRHHQFAVLGDAGIHEKVEPGFWDGVAGAVAAEFAKGRYADGLVRGITLAGEALAAHFPPRADDRNELPDEISR